jgi:hypothetical protein
MSRNPGGSLSRLERTARSADEPQRPLRGVRTRRQVQALALAQTTDDDLQRRSRGRRNHGGLRRELGSAGTFSGGRRQTGRNGATNDAGLELAGDDDLVHSLLGGRRGAPPSTSDPLAAKLYRQLRKKLPVGEEEVEEVADPALVGQLSRCEPAGNPRRLALPHMLGLAATGPGCRRS